MINTLPITKARKELPTLVDNANKKLDEYIITVNGAPAAVLMSAREYDSWKETVDISSDPKLMKSIKESEKEVDEGKGVTWEDAKKQLSWE
ncbi:MAG: type II toxin-antitoxin system Phd/YefM family antitoxin [Candidatus Daviesbacteria bacterium]|nr:type II toxin-antitoxin system Phd/YefM family antitoxin [Candidatus Daviesbacteria bacterium]